MPMTAKMSHKSGFLSKIAPKHVRMLTYVRPMAMPLGSAFQFMDVLKDTPKQDETTKYADDHLMTI